MPTIIDFIKSLLSVISGEDLLRRFPNGGAIILTRALGTSIVIYLATLIIKTGLEPYNSAFDFLTGMHTEFKQTIQWLGATFAAVYVGLYSRFASQWTYLSGQYSLIQSVELSSGLSAGEKSKLLAQWICRYVKEAETLHLATKPGIADQIQKMLLDPKVEQAFRQECSDGDRHYINLLDRVNRSVDLSLVRRRRRFNTI